MIDNNFSLRHGNLTEKGKKALRQLYASIRFHVLHDENVRQRPDKMRHYGYMDLSNWARENYRDEISKDDNWLILYEYGEWNGRWRLK